MAVLERDTERQDAANRRAALTAAAVYNVHRKKGQKPIQPDDFFKRRETAPVSDEEAVANMIAWATAQNARATH